MQTQFSSRPNWPALGVADALGGGPIIVRNGRAVWTAGEEFLPSQLAPRNPRTGIGQRRDGSLVMVVVDGRRRGYSVGLTNWELAQTLVRLGAVTASALDSGGSSTLAFDGGLLNRPSDPGGERAVKETLALMYTGVYAPAPALPVLSPNGDGQGERETLSYKIVRQSAVDAKLIDPTGATVYEDAGRPRTRRLPDHLAELGRPSSLGRAAPRDGPRARTLALDGERDRRPAAELVRLACLLGQRHARLPPGLAAHGACRQAPRGTASSRASRSSTRRA